MEDRRPWVRDITLFLHDLFVANPILGAGAAQILGRGARVAPDATARFIEAGTASDSVRNSREIAMLKAEIAYLRSAIAHEHERAMARARSEEHTSDLTSLMRISYAVFCFKKKIHTHSIT